VTAFQTGLTRTSLGKVQDNIIQLPMVFTLTNHGGRIIIQKYRFNYSLPVDRLSCEGTGSSIEIRIPIFGTRFNPIMCPTDVILQPFPELTPETVRKQKKGG